MDRRRLYGLALIAALVTFGVPPDGVAAQDRDRDRERIEEIIFAPRDRAERSDRTSRSDRTDGSEPRVVCRWVEGARVCTVERDRRDRRDRDGDAARRRGGRDAAGRAGGPPFCRNGRGHPVFGMRWCVEKGFGRSSRGILEDIILGGSRTGRVDRTLDRGDLTDILGEVILGRFTRYARAVGADGPLVGRWRDGDALRLMARGGPLAELLDRDGDGYVDAVTLYRSD